MPRARCAQQRKPLRRGRQERCRVGRAIEKRDQIEDLARLQRRAFDVQLLNQAP